MSECVLKVTDLKKRYGEVRAVDGISFEVKKGDVLAILGPNGAGKSTTVEMIEGLRKKDSGEIEYFGEKPVHITKEVKERMGVQLQKSAFLDNLTVKETLEFFGGLYKKALKSSELIDMMSLGEKQKSKVKNLSGGQLQRLAVAVSIVNDPDIVFLDEPTTGLDPQARRMLWEKIENLKVQGKTVIITTHYMEEAEVLADEIIIFDHGKIIARGTLQELLDSVSKGKYVEFSLDKVDGIPEELKKIEGFKEIEKNRYSLPTEDVEKTLSIIFNISHKENFYIENITIRKMNLEDVFLVLTGRSLRD
ncbi:MAG: type transport system ATP-binding protein [Kosmotogales bacterium]|jgi:ABC-2 type transport system ATP-binding protein|nr:type transport system ATP-binding protein [Kosmotogales bacterium]